LQLVFCVAVPYSEQRSENCFKLEQMSENCFKMERQAKLSEARGMHK